MKPKKAIPSSNELIDSRTGLPNQNSFNATLSRVPAPRMGVYLAAIFFRSLSYINARYGDATGDEVLLFCAQLLIAKVLEPSEQLFRWRGPAYCAILHRQGSFEEVQRLVRSRLGAQVRFEQSSGTLLLNVDLAVQVFSAESAGVGELCQSIDAFTFQPDYISRP